MNSHFASRSQEGAKALKSSESMSINELWAKTPSTYVWEWAEKPLDSPLTIDAEIHDAVMALPPDERRDRAKVNEAVPDGLKLGLLRPAG
jgi:hypothetical protein